MNKYVYIGGTRIAIDQYVVQGTALLGTKGAGKTWGAKTIAEQLLDADIPIVVFDPIGRWRFLKVGAGGSNSRGYEVVVAGGEQPDLPLTANGATEIVRAAIRERIPLVIDLYSRNLAKADWRRIVQSCFNTLLYENTAPLHVFLEETAEFAPQRIDDGLTYAAVEKLVRMGGNASVGITLINQRSQEVNKAVLDLCENLVLMRQRGSNAIDALEKWIDHLDPESAKIITRAMPNMGPGEAWVFTGSAEAAEHIQFGGLKSFHPDRSKPELSAKAMAARTSDTTGFVTRMSGELAKLIEVAKASDPATLQKQIRDLQQQLATRPQIDPNALHVARLQGFKEGADEVLKRANHVMAAAATDAERYRQDIVKAIGHVAPLQIGYVEAPTGLDLLPAGTPKAQVSIHPPNVKGKTRDALVEVAHTVGMKMDLSGLRTKRNGAGLSPSAQNILAAIHRAFPVSMSFDAAARRAGVSKLSSKYSKYREELDACIEVICVDGRYSTAPSYVGTEFGGMDQTAEEWAKKLPPSYGNMLKAIAKHVSIDAQGIAVAAGVSPTSSGLSKGINELLRLELIVKDGALYRLAEGLQS